MKTYPKKIAILGAGISGLATAWFLKRALGNQVELSLFEKAARVGGWIQTIEADGFLFEQGPRSCRTQGTGRQTLELIEALNLQDQVLVAHPSARRRFLYTQGRLRPLPRHLLTLPFSPLMKGWMKALWRDWTAPKAETPDESLYDFFSRRLSPEWCERLVDPFVSGIYAGDMRKLSVKSCFPLLHKWEQEQGSLLKGALRHPKRSPSTSSFVSSHERFPLFSFKKGMETLTQTLAHQLEGDIYLNSPIQTLTIQEEGIALTLANGKQVKADHVISALPAPALASLLHSPLLQKMTYATALVVNIGYHHSVLPQAGFGYLIPFQEREEILGCVFDSSVFPEQNSRKDETRLTVMLGGVQHPSIENYSEAQVIETALAAVRRHLKIELEPQTIKVHIAKQAIPQYEIGHHLLINHLSTLPHVTLTGSAFYGVSVNDCIAQAQKIAQQFG